MVFPTSGGEQPVISFPHLGLLGRLGNALFQFAATVSYATNFRTEPRFNPDWTHRPYFSVPDRLFEPVTGPSHYTPDLATHLDSRDRVYLQDITMFRERLPQIREYLKPSPLALDMMQDALRDTRHLKRPILSVHVRRGDNVPGQDPGVPNKEEYFVLPSEDYYLRAIKEFDHCASLAFFSDEPDWCERTFGSIADYVHHGTPRPKEHEPDFLTAPVLDWIDLQLMAQCDMHVVTGSTFSIWGALLADNVLDVVRPTPVYGPALAHIKEDLMFLPTWKVIPVSCS